MAQQSTNRTFFFSFEKKIINFFESNLKENYTFTVSFREGESDSLVESWETIGENDLIEWLIGRTG
jgi:hypothetical protein